MISGNFRGLPAALALLLFSSPAWAERVGCTAITTLPATISSPGTYCLTKDLATTEPELPAISVLSSDVQLDCNGHRIANTADNKATGIVIGQYYGTHPDDVAVEHCQVRGFLNGIVSVDFSDNIRIRDNTITQASFFGMLVKTRRGEVVGNTVQDMRVWRSTLLGCQTLVTGMAVASPDELSNAYGRDVLVADNHILDIGGGCPERQTSALSISGSSKAIARGNHVSGLPGGGWAFSGNYDFSATFDTIVTDNVFVNGGANQVQVGNTGAICRGNVFFGIDKATLPCDATSNAIR